MNRTKKVKLSILASLVGQIISIICGLIVPRILISTYGSEIYGATASITQFLAYISLLEGGIGGVGRAALYKPLAENDVDTVNRIISEISFFFRIVSLVFVFYTFVLAVSYKSISHVEGLDWYTSALLVIVISFSTLVQYYFGISRSVLVAADQRAYIAYLISIITLPINMIMVVLLSRAGVSIVWVKLVSSCIFILRPIFLTFYVKRNYPYNFNLKYKKNSSALPQKWTGLGQHIAYFLHSNTDVVVLTLFTNLKLVAVYAVYIMVINAVQNIVLSFANGMEAVFGDMIARNEKEKLDHSFNYFDTLISIVSCILFSCTLVLLIPFVKIYTSGIKDTNYIYPVFSVVIIMAAFLYCIRITYQNLIVAANHFAQTKLGAYGEVLINIVLSIVFVMKYQITGVAIATLIAVLFRYLYFSAYLSNNIIYKSVSYFIKRFFINMCSLAIIIIPGFLIIDRMEIANYYQWFIIGVLTALYAGIITLTLNYLFYKEDFKSILLRLGLTRK